jgi:hypothetical protein
MNFRAAAIIAAKMAINVSKITSKRGEKNVIIMAKHVPMH